MTSVNLMLGSLAVLTSLACMVLLFRSYAASGVRLLLWSAVCFAFLTINNVFLFFDLVVHPGVDLRPWRLGTALAGIVVLLYGLIWEGE